MTTETCTKFIRILKGRISESLEEFLGAVENHKL
jgi:hypothetical protein